MIPIGGQVTTDSNEAQVPSLTWKLDFDRGKVVGKTDGFDAVKQAAYKILQTDRFAYLIYDANYGSEMAGLIGKSPLLVESELHRQIREALIEDDRIHDVSDMTISIEGDVASVVFTVVSIFGNFEGEVTTYV
ncbi:DUF2634 domain-containing protein [Paenibacillus sp. PR3]|uniref:DUF2634 domain-containing protein n=1 Tax=Paenibacillus terricola TaxID=2763503 RepID=A0ABR8MNR8_9BACL|nr:DUF2634 domain-containing protein [Paenibacillus terricola]MBD3917637.1 DUF2634 domain-containing protein [Paenibacillus terricola]